MSKYVVYGSERCTYCNSAKDLLEDKQLDYEYVDIDKDEGAKKFIVDSGFRMIPQIYLQIRVGDKGESVKMKHIGGFEDLLRALRA